MVNTKMKIRNSSATLTGVFITLLLVMAIFFGGFAYLSQNSVATDRTLDSRYSQMRDNLTIFQEEISEETTNVRNNLSAMRQSGNRDAQI